jgi:N-acetylglucosamine kinase-like BadF-type ATPase
MDALSEASWLALAEAGVGVQALQGVCIAAAGVSSPAGRLALETCAHVLFPGVPLLVAPDYQAAYWGASKGEPGVVLCAGTGAVAYGRNAVGKEIRLDGRGFALGDLGSGFDLGRLAVRRTIWRLDLVKPLDSFDRWLLNRTECATANDLAAWVYSPFNPGRLAELGGEVCTRSGWGDKASSSLVRQAGKSLRTSALELLRGLELSNDAPVYMAGGLWKGSDVLAEAVRGKSPALNMLEPKRSAAWGAAAMFATGGNQEAAYTDR